mgnify:CR=1 FL=1
MRRALPPRATDAHANRAKWVELVRVRSSEEPLRATLPSLERQVRSVADSTPDAEALVLKHALYEGDLAVVLVWQASAAPARSREGLLVAESLRRLGSVEHAVWMPVDDDVPL